MAAKYGVKLLNAYEVPASQTAAYAVPTSLDRAVVSGFFAVNRDSEAQTLTVWVVPSTQTIADKHKTYAAIEIPAGGTRSLSDMIELPLNVGDAIYVQASLASAISLFLSASTFPSV